LSIKQNRKAESLADRANRRLAASGMRPQGHSAGLSPPRSSDRVVEDPDVELALLWVGIGTELWVGATGGLAIVYYAFDYYAFDVLRIGNESLLRQTLEARRERLRHAVLGSSVLLSEALPGSPDRIEREIRKLVLEGIIAKRRAVSTNVLHVQGRVLVASADRLTSANGGPPLSWTI
jgi:hypothetical protein